MIIAIDGPAASGKGTLAKRLAKAFGLSHLDTGLLYRATARTVLDRGGAVEDAAAATGAARSLDLTALDETRLRGRDMGEAASIVAAVPDVRAALLDVQRAFARRGPGAVLDGRDIGTVICPDADAKIFVVATAEARARRRHLELQSRGEVIDQCAVLAEIRLRDERDSNRSTAPLLPAADAITLDTTHLDADEAYAAALRIVQRRLEIGGEDPTRAHP